MLLNRGSGWARRCPQLFHQLVHIVARSANHNTQFGDVAGQIGVRLRFPLCQDGD